MRSANDNTYTTTKPSAVGEYTVRVTAAADDDYNEASATKDFAITYLDAPNPAYTISGTEGTDDWYTSDVTIIPLEGYTVSSSLNSEYSDSLTISAREENVTIYLKNEKGQMTDAISVGEIKIDKDDPFIAATGNTEDYLTDDTAEITVDVYKRQVLWVIFGTIRHMTDESKMELIGKNAEYLQGQLALAKENELTAKTIRHDFHHHNRNITALLQKGDVEGALRYIEQYDESLEETRPKEFCEHATVNAILSSFYTRAQKEGITFSVFADTPERSPIADMDFVAILSNLLENALNGCRESGMNGEIRGDIRTVGDKTVIVCSNPCKTDLAIENGMLRNRSTGIDSVVLAARKYGGDIRYDLEDGYLTVCVILNA